MEKTVFGSRFGGHVSRLRPALPRRSISAAVPIAFLCVAEAIAAQDVRCDPSILGIRQESEHGYQLRGNRCEGTYRPEVTTPAMWVAAFHETTEDFDISAEGRLSLAWESPAQLGGQVSLQAQSVKLREFYRMDSQRPSGSGMFDWPTSLLAARGLRLSDIGVRAYARSGAATLYLPLRIGNSEPVSGAGTYTLTLVPNVRLNDVLVSLAPVEAAGDMPSDSAYIRRNESLGETIYITQQPISVALGDLPRPGIYVAEVAGIMASGDALPTVRIWFYHAG